MAECVIVHPLKPIQAPRLTGDLVSQQGSIERFGVRPPQLGIGIAPPGYPALGILGVKKPAVLVVPAEFEVPLDRFGRLSQARLFGCTLVDVDHEPH